MTQETEKSQSRLQRWREKLKHTYRLVIMNNETFEEVGSYRLNIFNVYILISSVIVVVALLVVLLIAFSPVRKYIPGYGDVMRDGEILEVYNQLREMEDEFEAHRNYSDNFRRMLVGDVQTEGDIPKVNTSVHDSLVNFSELEPSEIDEQLRKEVELEELGEAVKGGSSTNRSPFEKPLEQIFFSPPVNGEISAGFMTNKKHYGVDILAPKNTAIKSAMDGYVFLSDWTLETGNTIGIQHANNIITFYKHNSALLKKVGSYVKAGEAVAIIGNTGTLSNGPHLHFELWYKGKPVDPTEYVDF